MWNVVDNTDTFYTYNMRSLYSDTLFIYYKTQVRKSITITKYNTDLDYTDFTFEKI